MPNPTRLWRISGFGRLVMWFNVLIPYRSRARLPEAGHQADQAEAAKIAQQGADADNDQQNRSDRRPGSPHLVRVCDHDHHLLIK